MPIMTSPTTPSAQPNRITRRATHRAANRTRRRGGRWRAGLVAAAATAALVGTAGAPMAAAATTSSTGQQGDIVIGGVNLRDYGIDITKLGGENPDLSELDVQKLLTLLDNPVVRRIVESCRTGGLAGGGSAGGGGGADCSGSTGTGAALVLPDRVDLASVADQITINLGPDKQVIIVTIPLGEQTPFGVLSALAVQPTGLIKTGLAVFGLTDMDPTAIGKYKTLADVTAAAALPYKPVEERYCTRTICIIGGWAYRTVDGNLATRTEALKIAGQLSGRTYDYTQPTVLTFSQGPTGSSTILGDGYSFALSRNGAAALAQTKFKLALALAGADGAGATSQATAGLGLALALNMNTSTMGLDWFGSRLNFDKIKESKVLDLLARFDMLPAGIDADTITNAMDLAQNLTLPDLKEVSCLGASSSASASGLGECSNTLGLFDYYRDLRPATVGQTRQTSWGLTDPTSLFLGNGNLLARGLTPGAIAVLTALAGGDLSAIPPAELAALLQNPVVKEAMEALFSEEKRLKLTKDFLRFTKEVSTTGTEVPVLDENGAPVLDENGTPKVTTSTSSSTRYLLTSDYGLRSPITVDWLGYRLTVFPAAEVNGTMRPNYLGMPTITRLDGGASLIPRIGLIELENPFGLGTMPIRPFAPFSALDSWISSITLKQDIDRVKDVLPLAEKALSQDEEPATEAAAPVAAAALSAPADSAARRVTADDEKSTPAPSPSTETKAVEAPTTTTPEPAAPTTEDTATESTSTPDPEGTPESAPGADTDAAAGVDGEASATEVAADAEAETETESATTVDAAA